MCYRPTVRYDAAYQTYINSLFRATMLDRNQLIRLALFTAGHSDDYYAILRQYARKDVLTLPSPIWKPDQTGYWMEQVFAVDEEVTAVESNEGRQQAPTRQSRPVHNESRQTIRITNEGGIRFALE